MNAEACWSTGCGHPERLHWGHDGGCRVSGCTCPVFVSAAQTEPEPQFADINIRLPLDGKAYTFTISGKERPDAEPT